jgi:lipopolysaccharide transport system permease protein
MPFKDGNTPDGGSRRTSKKLVVVLEARKGWELVDWREVIEYRDLLYFMVLREITVLYNQTILGVAWAIITPLFSVAVFTIVFGNMAQVPSDGIPYPIFSYSALLPWTYFAAAFTGSTGSLLQGTSLFTKVYFPRVFLPVVPILAKLVDFGIAFVILAAMMVWYGIWPTWNILYLPLMVFLMMLTATGMGLWLSALALQYRDVRHATTIIVQVLMYATPVVWPLSLVPQEYRLWYGLYPMAGVIEGFRATLLGRSPIPWDVLGMGAITATLLFLLGLVYFRRMERFFADVA